MSVYIEAYNESLNKYGEELCGDTVKTVRTKDFVVAVLADGLGSGVKANILSTLTSQIISSMISGGATIDDALETITSTLPVCSERGVAYCTFTIIQIFSNGEAYIAEFDNPELVLFRLGRVMELPSTKRELYGKTIYERRIRVMPEDTFVAFSDGAIHAGVGSVLNLGWQRPNIVDYLKEHFRPGMSAAVMTKLLLSACDCLYDSKPGDDTTVMTLRVRTPRQLNLLIGPPADKERDFEYVYRFKSLPGMHVVCGGTTSQLVSRVLNLKMKVSLNYDDPKVPPTASIQGMDLVTEGVLTISRTLQHMQEFAQKGGRAQGNISVTGKSGAAQLARMMIDECTKLHIMLGMARNPAHQNPDLPLDLDLKKRILADIAKLVEGMGKEVEIEYY